jgi:hypothetical protein
MNIGFLTRLLPWICNAVIAIRWRGPNVAVIPGFLRLSPGPAIDQPISILPWLFICNVALAAFLNAFTVIRKGLAQYKLS